MLGPFFAKNKLSPAVQDRADQEELQIPELVA